MLEKTIFWTVKRSDWKYMSFAGKWTKKLNCCRSMTSEDAHSFVKNNKEKYNGLKVIKVQMNRTFKEVN